MKKIIFFSVYFLFILGCVFSQEKIESPRLKFINEAYKYLKTPYKYASASKSGMDCSGLVYISALNALNKSLPRRAVDIANYAKKIKRADIQPGDLLFFITFGNKISHVAIYIGDGQFIHSASDGKKTGVIISSLTENYWGKSFVSAGRILAKEDIF